MKCYTCSNLIERDEALVCTKCKHTYHYTCLNITTAAFMANAFEYKRSWVCSLCLNVTQRKRIPIEESAADMSCDDVSVGDESVSYDSTKTTSQVESQTTPKTSFSSSTITLNQFADLLDTKLDKKLDNIRVSLAEEIKQEFRDLINKMEVDFKRTTDSLSVEIIDVRRDVTALNDVVQSLKKENLRLNSDLEILRCKQTNTSDTSQLEETISQLQFQINDREQQYLLNDVEVTGIPEIPGEQLSQTFISIATYLGVEVTQQDIVYIERVGARKHQRSVGESDGGSGGGAAAAAGAATQPQRPRPIAVRLSRRLLRDQLIRSARVKRTLKTGDLGLPVHSNAPYYINERLTRVNRVLFGKAREMGRILGWKFVWTKDGRVYAKRTDSYNCPARLLKTEKDLNRIFGVEPKKGSE